MIMDEYELLQQIIKKKLKAKRIKKALSKNVLYLQTQKEIEQFFELTEVDKIEINDDIFVRSDECMGFNLVYCDPRIKTNYIQKNHLINLKEFSLRYVNKNSYNTYNSMMYLINYCYYGAILKLMKITQKILFCYFSHYWSLTLKEVSKSNVRLKVPKEVYDAYKTIINGGYKTLRDVQLDNSLKIDDLLKFDERLLDIPITKIMNFLEEE